MKIEWHKLGSGQQSEYLTSLSRFLVERGYVSGKTEEQLAKEIYEKSEDRVR